MITKVYAVTVLAVFIVKFLVEKLKQLTIHDNRTLVVVLMMLVFHIYFNFNFNFFFVLFIIVSCSVAYLNNLQKMNLFFGILNRNLKIYGSHLWKFNFKYLVSDFVNYTKNHWCAASNCNFIYLYCCSFNFITC